MPKGITITTKGGLKPRKFKVRESVIVKQCLEHLEHLGYLAWRNNSGLMFVQGRRIQLAPAGTPDIVGLDLKGGFIGVECKAEKGYQSDNQKMFEEKIKKNKGIYLLVHSVEELKEKLNEETRP